MFKMASSALLILLVPVLVLNLVFQVPLEREKRHQLESDPAWTQAADEIENWVRQNHQSGIFLLASRGEIKALRSYGWADIKGREPVAPSTRFNIGSLAKQFTGFIVAELEREEKIELDERVDRYLPELARAPAGALPIVTLLQHTSGLPLLPRFATYLQVQTGTRAWSTGEFIEEIRAYRPDLEPGSKFQYSNVGYRLLAAVVERIEGKPFHEVLRARVLAPFDLRDTYLAEASESPERLAVGYGPIPRFVFSGGPLQLPLPNWNYSMLVGAGGMVTSVTDLYKWDRGLAKSSASTPEFARRYFAGGGPANYHFGWQIEPAGQTPPTPAFQIHTGGTPGFSSLIIRLPEDDAVAILLVNSFWSSLPGESRFYRELVRAMHRAGGKE